MESVIEITRNTHLAIDPIGDGYYPIPHVLVDFTREGGPFAPGNGQHFDPYGGQFGGFSMKPSLETRAALFPKPMPGALYPPPSSIQFMPGTPPAQLSADFAKRIEGSLATVRRPKAAPPLSPMAAVPAVVVEQPPRRFQKWAEAVAIPVLQAFAEKLRALGHEAWLERASEAGSEEYPPVEKVSIECRVRAPTTGNPEYRVRGHLVVFWDSTSPSGVTIETSPGGERDSYRPAFRRTSLEQLSADAFQAELVTLIDRVAADGKRVI